MRSAIGVDIGGTKCAVSFGRQINGSIEIAEKICFKTEGAYGEVLSKLLDASKKLISEYCKENEQFCGIGISCGGPLDSKKGVIQSPPNLKGWDDVRVVEYFEKQLNQSARLMNDADACAVAEWKFGAGKGCENMIFLTFGTGLGAGLILGGRLYSGTTNTAGECGHMRLERFGPVGYGKQGSFEGFCSGGGIAQIGQTLILEKLQTGEKVSYCQNAGELSLITAKTLAQQAEKGDSLALETYRISGEQLGKGLSLLVDILNPEMIVIGSIFCRSHKLLWEHARAVMERECLPQSFKACKVEKAGLGESIGDFAALSVAFYE